MFSACWCIWSHWYSCHTLRWRRAVQACPDRQTRWKKVNLKRWHCASSVWLQVPWRLWTTSMSFWSRGWDERRKRPSTFSCTRSRVRYKRVWSTSSAECCPSPFWCESRQLCNLRRLPRVVTYEWGRGQPYPGRTLCTETTCQWPPPEEKIRVEDLKCDSHWGKKFVIYPKIHIFENLIFDKILI